MLQIMSTVTGSVVVILHFMSAVTGNDGNMLYTGSALRFLSGRKGRGFVPCGSARPFFVTLPKVIGLNWRKVSR